MTILVTRPSPDGDELVTRLRSMGKEAWALPLIEFGPGDDLPRLPGLVSGLQAGDLIFALSQHAISYAQPVLNETNVRWPPSVGYYAIGRKTALALHTASARPVGWPKERSTSEILIQLPILNSVAGKQALILRGNGGRELLATTLVERGATVHIVECYQRRGKVYDGAIEGKRWRDRQITTLVVTSGEMLQQLYQLFPDVDRNEWLLHCRLVVASARLATLARESGWACITVADGADNDALLRALQ
ncbi:uroporphyrinogen-III synthase [Izhakiella capsodis]|uniref:Uroporphyrinogen-III synthase n=1 Tax=Izhakiella capsodis TaxID=1367852 RepID=A0A1I4ZML6_9GAMM|nr:uroporphyrinogen-III synthase [Izhakiella capsodis]SFN51283.1 uroporphyrinogen-III synthase [Izhakiella capsodis]